MGTEIMSNSSAAPTSALSTPPSTPVAAGDFRFGSEAPEWARGKSASEVLRMTEDMYGALQRVQQPQAQAQPTPSAPSVAGQPTMQTWVNDPTAAARDVATSTFAPAFQSLAQQNASTLKFMIRQKYTKEFDRWGPEIETTLAGVPPERLTLDLLDQAVTLVQGRHVNELVAERARELMAQGGSGMERPDGSSAAGGAGVGNTRLSLDNLPPAVSEAAKRVGLTTQHVIEHCRATGQTPEQWLAQANDQKVLTSVSPFSFQMGEDALGINKSFS
jgi:AraC-like DNA-binding protein